MTQVQAATPNSITRFVPLKNLKTDLGPWTNPRTFTGLEKDKIAELAADIKAHHTKERCGILTPPQVQQVYYNGELYDLLVDGQRRIKAGSTVMPGDTLIPVFDRDPTPRDLTQDLVDELLEVSFSIGNREGLSSFELSEVALDMKERGKTLGKISKVIRRSESWISKILKARESASDKTLRMWKNGELTDEAFKALAEEKDAEAQAKKAQEVAEARKSGDKSEARARAAEVKERAKTERAAKPDKAKVPRAVTGPQLDLIKDDKASKPEASKPAPKAAKPPSKAVIEDMLGMAQKRPPTDPYVKGLMDGVAYAAGEKDPATFAKPWLKYLARIEGKSLTAPKAKPERKARKATKKATKKARKPGKAKR